MRRFWLQYLALPLEKAKRWSPKSIKSMKRFISEVVTIVCFAYVPLDNMSLFFLLQ